MTKKSILIIDDDSFIRDILYEHFLQQYKPYIFLVQSAEEAIRKLEVLQFHLIVCDFEMPNGNGDSVLSYHREHKLRGNFIFFTGLSKYEGIREKYSVHVVYEKKFTTLFDLIEKIMGE